MLYRQVLSIFLNSTKNINLPAKNEKMRYSNSTGTLQASAFNLSKSYKSFFLLRIRKWVIPIQMKHHRQVLWFFLNAKENITFRCVLYFFSGFHSSWECRDLEKSSVSKQSRFRTRWRRLTRLAPGVSWPMCWTWTMISKHLQHCPQPVSTSHLN